MLWRRIRAQNPNIEERKLDIETDWHRDMQSEVKRDKLQKETLTKRQTLRQAQDDTGLCETTARNALSTNRLVLTRQLQHKADIPLSG